MSSNFTPTKPDYNVAAMDKKTERRGTIGVAWKNEDGSIRIKLNPFLVIDTNMMDLVITLFPADQPFKPKKRVERTVEEYETPSEIVGDEIPF